MTKADVLRLFGVIASLYPNAVRFAEADASMRDAWHELLQDIDLRIAGKAVAAHAATHDFPPTIAEIRRFCFQSDGESAEEAWARVLHALKDSAYHSAERFADLPDVCKRLVGSASVLKEWAISEDGTSISVARTRFVAQYDVEKRKEKERKLIPPSVRQALDAALNVNLLPDETISVDTEQFERDMDKLSDTVDSLIKKDDFDALVVDLGEA